MRLPCLSRLPWLTLGLAAVVCLLSASPAFAPALEFHRASMDAGEYWRLITAHLVHFDTDHLRWDVAALLILGSLAERDGRSNFALTLAAAALAIGVGIWAGRPDLETYRGLSGIDSAIFGLVCARLVNDGWRVRHGFSVAVGALALAGFTMKCAVEFTGGATVFATTGAGPAPAYVPVPLAHVIGLAIGLAGALLGGFFPFPPFRSLRLRDTPKAARSGVGA